MGNKVYLKNIEQIDDNSHIKVRVLKMWNFIKNNMVCSTAMIIMDKEIWSLLKEDESYIIIKPNMAVVIKGFSYTCHKQTITLDWKSILKKCEDFLSLVNGFFLLILILL
uniref:DUF223 domain-containing protein n=1 Tax=Lactuca sativa TaxID=4236 RepID=A0A9R1WB76_LACSA|nr:hypothetical protein LSAT_V11C300110430 [Lactuca sativa]